MIFMTKTMRWYGLHDATSLINIKQCGVKGIVTALHEVPVGDIWTIEAITERKKLIEDVGLEWKVVESLPVHEDIKKRSGDYDKYIKNYKISLKNLAQCGIEVVTYNFMPILDWIRTHHKYKNQDDTETLYFDREAFMYFDMFLLKRPNARASYNREEIASAIEYGKNLTNKEKKELFRSCVVALPGSTTDFTADEILKLLDEYKHVDDAVMRENLVLFLKEVAPTAQELGIKLAIHPDDPPYSLLGLPRIVSTLEDIKLIFDEVPLEANGLCYCTGSFGAHPKNNLLDILNYAAKRIHFLHLRNVSKDTKGNFRESEHLIGDNRMEQIVDRIIQIMIERNISLPMRPDHGFLHDIESGKKLYPGYSMIGRLKGLAEISGLELGIQYKMNG